MTILRLKKGQERRVRRGHPWIYSNEIDSSASPLKSFAPGQEVIVEAYNKERLGAAYVNPHSLIAGRLFSRDPNSRLNLDFFIEKLQIALLLRNKLYPKPYYRLVFSEADGLPGLIIDRFGNDLVMQINTAGMERVKPTIVEALQAVLPEMNSILLRNDSAIRLQEGLESSVEALFGEPPEMVSLEENDAKFTAPIWKGQKTGWFFDHRMNRAHLKQYVQNQSVLDVFSYLGGFGIQAALLGANHVDCIESSASASELIKTNAALNNVSDKINVITDDAFDALKKLLKEGKKYGVVILDPPAFVKKIKDMKEGIVAYQRLNELAIKLLEPGGILVSCSCSMHVSMQDLIDTLQRAAYNVRRDIKVIERGHQGPDHPVHTAVPETDYLKAVFVSAS